MSRIRCYGPAGVLLVYAILLIIGVSNDVLLFPFLVAEAVAIWVHIRDLRLRLHNDEELQRRR